MNLLPPRPLKLDPDFLVRLGLQSALGVVVGLSIVTTVIRSHPLRNELTLLAIAAASIVLGMLRSRPFWRYRGFARHGEEVEVEVIESVQGGGFRLPIEGREVGLQAGGADSGLFRLRIGDVELLHEAADADEWPLFLDPARKSALMLRHGGRLLVVRNDFHPFDISPEEDGAIRARIEARHQLRKLMGDIHTC